MKKTSAKDESPVTAPKRNVAIKDLKAKDAGVVKGGAAGTSGSWDIIQHKKV